MEIRIYIEKEKEDSYLMIEASETSEINYLAINMTKNETTDNLLFGYFSYDNLRNAQFDITDYIPLMDTFNQFVSRDDVLKKIKSIYAIMIELENKFLCEPDIILQKEYIFVEKNTGIIKVVPSPVVLDGSNNVKNLVMDILNSANWKKNEKTDFVIELREALEKNISYDGMIGKLIQIMERPIEYVPVDNLIPTPPSGIIAKNISIPESNMQNMMPVNDSETQVLSQVEDGQTTVLGVSNQLTVFPILVRIKTNERIVINKNEFLIGKEPSRVDYCIFDNSAVSRIHAKIISKNGEFFVVDNHSTNHVYVNGMLVQPDLEVRLSHSSRVRLGDEDFEFRFQ